MRALVLILLLTGCQTVEEPTIPRDVLCGVVTCR